MKDLLDGILLIVLFPLLLLIALCRGERPKLFCERWHESFMWAAEDLGESLEEAVR